MTEALAYDTRAEADQTPDRKVRRWLLEIKLAQKRERDWRKTGQSIWKRYQSKDRKKSSFNILWANTETLRPALYNSPPKPDVRRRFRQGDLLGKAVGELTERALTYCVDAYDLDLVVKQDVLESLLPGRGISRVRYVPKINQVPGVATDAAGTADAEATEGNREEVEYEQALCEHVQWDDLLTGPGKTWEEVCWIAFRHRLTKDDLIEKFGEAIAKEIKLDATDDDDLKAKDNEDVAEVFKRAELWEVWDKDAKQVFFVSQSYKKDVLYADGSNGEPPLKLRNFYPIPRPLQMVEDTQTLIPTPLYELYCEQAEELNSISVRINKLIAMCRVRFAHDPSLTELSELMTAGDGDGIPVENARAWMNNGGLEKAIWWMPIDQVVTVLKELYLARDTCKAVIYELTGISDIVRGDTDPNETLGAQQLKANYSSVRLQRMKREVQRYVRDLIRLLAEVIGEHFSHETLSTMTGMNFPTNVQKQELQLQAQVLSAKQQPIPEQMQHALMMPSWEEIMAVLKSDMQREYRVDVETDSTVAETLSEDMSGLREVLSGLVEFWTGVGPAVQSGALKIEAVKAISMTIVRRARMGLEVEDALETGMQQPAPQSDPNAAKAAQAQHQQQLAQQQLAHQQQMAQRQQQHEEQIAQRQMELEQAKALVQAHADEAKSQRELAAQQQQALLDAAFARFDALLKARTAIEVAEIGAQATLQTSQETAAEEATT